MLWVYNYFCSWKFWILKNSHEFLFPSLMQLYFSFQKEIVPGLWWLHTYLVCLGSTDMLIYQWILCKFVALDWYLPWLLLDLLPHSTLGHASISLQFTWQCSQITPHPHSSTHSLTTCEKWVSLYWVTSLWREMNNLPDNHGHQSDYTFFPNKWFCYVCLKFMLNFSWVGWVLSSICL